MIDRENLLLNIVKKNPKNNLSFIAKKFLKATLNDADKVVENHDIYMRNLNLVRITLKRLVEQRKIRLKKEESERGEIKHKNIYW